MNMKNVLLQIINLLRPKFHNYITFSVVSAGLTIIATPLYQQVLIELIEKYLSVQLPDENLVGWGVGLVAIGLVYHFLMTVGYEWLSTKKINLSEQQQIVMQQERVEHDKRIFRHADKIMSGTFVHDFLDWVSNDHSYNHCDYDKLRNYCHFLALDENQFVSPGLQAITQELLKSSLRFLNFLNFDFDIYPIRKCDDGSRSCMHPNRNCDRNGNGTAHDDKFYSSKTVELNSLINDLRSRYSAFRAEIKKQLVV